MSHRVAYGIIIFFLVVVQVTAESIIYVDDDAPTGGDGLSWASPYASLQDALETAGDSAATQSAEIRIAGGTYRPTAPSRPDEPRTATFTLISRVAIRGGYRGLAGGGDPDDRNVAAFATVLSGDIGVPGALGDNSYHVVTGDGTDGTAVLDGVTVTAGNADGIDEDRYGGGLYCRDGSPTLIRCAFHANVAFGDRPRGGGMYNDTGSPTLTECQFIENRTGGSDEDGAGMYNGTGGPTLTDCLFSGNSAEGPDSDAGGMFNGSGSPTLTRCVFLQNSADERGGGMRNSGNLMLIQCDFIENESNLWGGGLFTTSGATLIDCTFRDNWASGFGGGIYHQGGIMLSLTRCVFVENTADEGGGMFTGSAFLTNCVFRKNTANYGGGMTNTSGDTTVVNGMFSGNTAVEGGGVVNSRLSPTFVNCVFNGNSASQVGGGLYQIDNGSPTLTNCIIWDNEAPWDGQISDAGFGATLATYSCIQGGWPGEGNIDADPLFVDADGPDEVPGTADDNLRLQAGSPCVNAGTIDAPALPDVDLDGHARVLCDEVDMGAYESGIGDHECDQDVNLADFAAWGNCMTGPGGGPYAEGCETFDYEHDGDVDLRDFAGFQRGIHGVVVE